MKKISRNHQDLLQNIKFILVSGYRNDNTIDDSVVSDALREIAYGKTTDDLRVRVMVEELKEIRAIRGEVSDALWKDALRVVLQSIHNHSSLSPGTTDYLNFVSHFIK